MIVVSPSSRWGRGTRVSAAPSPVSAYVGDSLTDNSYEITTGTWMGGLNTGFMRPALNAGIAGDTVSMVLARIDNLYTNTGAPGLSGLAAAMGVPKLGYVFLRIGTNNARNLDTYSTISANFVSLMTKLQGYADRVIVCAVPPICSPESNFAAKNTCSIDINAGQSAYCAANASTCVFIDDSVATRVGGSPSGAGIASYFVDGIHFAQSGVRATGVAGGAGAATALSAWGITPSSPLVTSNANSYASNPAIPQWNNNPANSGSGANSNGNFPGTVPTGVTVAPSGTGSGTCATVASADSNPVPWVRVTPTAGQGSAWTQISFAASGRSITSGDPTRVEALLQVRFNALDLTNVKRLTFSARGNTTNNRYLLPDFWLGLGPEATMYSGEVIMRSNLPRVLATTESGITLFAALEYQNTFSGASMGSVDFRCMSLWG